MHLMQKWLKNRREQIGITQDELSTQLELEGFAVTRATISHWETGKAEPDFNNPRFRAALANALKMSIHTMLIAAGYEFRSQFSDDALRAADIVDHLTEDKKKLALVLLEQIRQGV